MEPESTASPEAPPPSKLHVVFFNERGLRAGWRLLIFAAMLIAAQAFVFGVLFLIRGGRNRPPQNVMLQPERLLVAELLSFFLVVFVTWLMSRIERRAM